MCCLPLQVFVWCQIVLTYFLTLLFSILTILLFFNEYVEGYYAFLMFLFILPLYGACGINLWYASDKSQKGRAFLKLSCIFVLVSVTLICLWAIMYNWSITPYHEVYIGSGSKKNGSYSKVSKATYVWEQILCLSIISVIYVTSWIACEQWANCAN